MLMQYRALTFWLLKEVCIFQSLIRICTYWNYIADLLYCNFNKTEFLISTPANITTDWIFKRMCCNGNMKGLEILPTSLLYTGWGLGGGDGAFTGWGWVIGMDSSGPSAWWAELWYGSLSSLVSSVTAEDKPNADGISGILIGTTCVSNRAMGGALTSTLAAAAAAAAAAEKTF